MTQTTKVPELQRIAALSVALCLWNQIDDIRNAVWQENNSLNDFESISKSVLKLLAHNLLKSLPTSILELIADYVEIVRDEIRKWVSYHQQKIFFVINEYHSVCHFDHFVWNPDGTISYVQTALRLQSSLRLSELEKFRFLCQYCLKHEIEQKWKLLFENKIFDSVPFEENPLLCYWYCYCLKRLQNVPLIRGLSSDESMFRNESVDNWPAKEYFFDRTNVDEQIQNAIWIIDSEFPTFQKNLIGKLNPTQRNTLFMNRSVAIFMNYCTKLDGDHILSTWYEAAEVITRDEFSELLEYFLVKKVRFQIVTEVWISAPDALKIHVLNSRKENLIVSIWNLWMKFYDGDLLKLLSNTSTNVKDEIKWMKIFHHHCSRLLVENRSSTLFSVLNSCFSKFSGMESFKRALAQNDWFIKHCKNLVMKKKSSSVTQLCDFFASVIDVNQLRSDLVKNNFFDGHCRNLLKNGELPELETLLNFCFSNVESEQSIRNRFDTASLINLCENLITECKLNISDADKILKILGYGAENLVQFRRGVVAKPFFADKCLKFICCDEISNLEKYLEVFPCPEEAVRFKRSLRDRIISSDYCERLITDDGISMLEQLLKFFQLGDEELERFKENIVQKFIANNEYRRLKIFSESFLFGSSADRNAFRRNIVRNREQELIIDHKLSEFDRLLNSLYSRWEEQVIEELKRDLAKEKFFFDYCLELVEKSKVSMLDELLKFCFGDDDRIESWTTFKKKLADESTFRSHCQRLTNSDNLSTLKKLINWIFSDTQELARYKKGLADLESVKERCLGFFATEDLKGLNDSLSYFFPLDSQLMLEYKQNLVLSEQGIEICFSLVDRPRKILTNMISKKLSYDKLVDFERKIIFSATAISLLKKMIRENQLENALKCCKRFAFSNEDRKMLRIRLWDNPNDMVASWFFKSNRNYVKSLINWWLPDRNTYLECKNALSVDEIFEAGLRDCLFESSDSSGQVSDCALKKNFGMKALNRFLTWYFKSPKQIKAYKAQKMKPYQDMETIRVLLEKRAEISYFDEILNWFFERDAQEISNFNKKWA